MLLLIDCARHQFSKTSEREIDMYRDRGQLKPIQSFENGSKFIVHAAESLAIHCCRVGHGGTLSGRQPD
jgi:hypothetical protein